MKDGDRLNEYYADRWADREKRDLHSNNREREKENVREHTTEKVRTDRE